MDANLVLYHLNLSDECDCWYIKCIMQSYSYAIASYEQYHIISYDTMLYHYIKHNIACIMLQYKIVSDGMILYYLNHDIIWHNIVEYDTILYHLIWYNMIQYCVILYYNIISYDYCINRIVWYCIILINVLSYDIIWNCTYNNTLLYHLIWFSVL